MRWAAVGDAKESSPLAGRVEMASAVRADFSSVCGAGLMMPSAPRCQHWKSHCRPDLFGGPVTDVQSSQECLDLGKFLWRKFARIW